MSNVVEINCTTGEVTIRPMTPEEEAQQALDEQAAEEAAREELLKSLAQERVSRLRESEWTQLRDSPLSNQRRAAWAAYRQLLRDMLLGVDPFPTKPPEEEA